MHYAAIEYGEQNLIFTVIVFIMVITATVMGDRDYPSCLKD
jgi:hypothetical protein